MRNDPQKPSYAIRKDKKHTNVPKNRKDKFDDNLISNDNMSNDFRTPPDAIEKNEKHTNETIDWYNKSVDDIMVSNPQTCRKVSGDHETDTSGVIDDPRRGARLTDSERKETESGPTDTSPTKGVIDDNMSNDPQNPADSIGKDEKQKDRVINRKNRVVDDNMSNDPRNPAD